MNIIEATIAFLFRPTVDIDKAERQRQKTCRILRNITDPAEAVGECINEQHNDTTAKASSGTDSSATHGR